MQDLRRILARRPLAITLGCAAVLVVSGAVNRAPSPHAPDPGVVQAADSGGLWLAPAPALLTARAPLARAVDALNTNEPADALPVFTKYAGDPEIGPYATLYAGRAALRLSRPLEAARAAASILEASPSDALAEAALELTVAAAEAQNDTAAKRQALKGLTERPVSAPATARLRYLKASLAAGDVAEAARMYYVLYYDFAGLQEATDAAAEIKRVGLSAPAVTRDAAARAVSRAERLFGLKQFADARAAYEAARPHLDGDARARADLRIAQSDAGLKRLPAAAGALRTIADKGGPFADEARYSYLGILRDMGRTTEYVDGVAAFAVNGEPSWAERALNELGTYHILENEDEEAAKVFAQMYARFPAGAFGDRAAWRAGWWSYKNGDHAETVRIFESAAVTHRRADYRPSWLYWAARAHGQLGHRTEALDGFRRVIADYRNSYYGRAAIREVESIQAAMRPAGAGPVSPARLTLPAALVPGVRPPNASTIEHLLAAGMFDEAIAELRRLQASGQGSPMVEATLGYALNRQGKLRPGIQAMRRAYPQFMAEGGEALPLPILQVIFPIDYWELIQTHASAKRLDPFLVAALVAQESTFQADVRSVANAWGLMQIIPGTGRRYATTLGIKPFATSRLTDPEINVRIGTTYFSDLMRQFGDAAPALAAYNAGENRVERWLADRPGVDRDEFIDDIPFPETQNYVKRILGTAEDYRILYGNGKR
jgi:soluble lytic murein transglycosylase